MPVKGPVPDRIDAAMQPVQGSAPQPLHDGLEGQPKRAQLIERYHAALFGGEASDRQVDPAVP